MMYLAVAKDMTGLVLGSGYLQSHHNGITGEVKLVGPIPISVPGTIELVEIHHSEDDMDGIMLTFGKENRIYGMRLAAGDTLSFN